MNRPAAVRLPQQAPAPRSRVVRAATRARALLLVLAALMPAALAQRVELLDRIVAVVNADVITRLELDRENSIAQEALRRQGTPLPQRDVLEKQLRLEARRALRMPLK